jgi:hypothetical protein
MPTYNTSVDLSHLFHGVSVLHDEILARISQVVAATAEAGRLMWADDVMKAKGIWSQEKQDYAKSIKVRHINEYESEIFSDYKFASDIETGRPSRDLKRMLDTSTKVRISAKGVRYLIIPFRHNTPGSDAHAQSMPQEIYSLVRNRGKFASGSVTGIGMRLSVLGAYNIKSQSKILAPQRSYQWGSRLGAGMLGPNQKGKTDRYAGMVAFDTSSKLPGSKQSSKYLTFRVMTENSNGWIVAAQPGRFIAQKVSSELQPMFERAIAHSIQF